MSLLKDFEALCRYVRECTGDDIVCGLCEYDAGTLGEEKIECPGFESNECFVLKESLRKQYEMYDQVVRCKDCKYRTVNEHCRDPRFAAMCDLDTGDPFELGRNAYDDNWFCADGERKE